MDHEPDEEIAELVGDLVQAARVPAKRRPFPVKPTVERLTSLAYEHGLLPDALRDLVDLVTASGGGHLDQASLGALVRNLYPAGASVGDDVVLAVLASLGHGQHKPSLPVQALLLRWLVLVYHVLTATGAGGIGSASVLSRSYAVLFNLLDTAAIRPQLCHLLALITRRRHVRPFRIQAILNLSRQTGHDAYLLGLLRVFKNYYPEVIVGEVTRGRAAPFKHPDPAWRARLDEIRLARRQRQLEAGAGAGVETQNSFRVRQTVLGRHLTAGGSIPAVHTAHAQEDSVTLEEIESAEGLVQNLESIELPSQMVAVLADPLLQKFLLLRPADDAFTRLENWMAACIDSAASGDSGDGELLDLLEVVHEYVINTKTFPPVLRRFFAELLSGWNGIEKKDLVLETLSFVPVLDFQETYETAFGLLEAKLLDNSVDSQLDLLAFYTLVLEHWSVSLAAIGQDESMTGEAAALPAFIQHVNGLALAVLQNSAATAASAADSSGSGVAPLAALAILDFYEEVTVVLGLGREILEHVEEVIPPDELVYTLHFSQSAAVAARLYAVLAAYKRALEEAMQRRPGRQLTMQERARVNRFNGFLMDVCNCLWRSRAFSSAADANAQGCRMPPVLVPRLAAYLQGLDRDLTLAAVFGLTLSPTLCLQAITYLRELEEAAMTRAEVSGPRLERRLAGPVTPTALAQLAASGGLSVTWAAFRTGLLEYLERQGLGGVSALMYNTMKNLMNARGGR